MILEEKQIKGMSSQAIVNSFEENESDVKKYTKQYKQAEKSYLSAQKLVDIYTKQMSFYYSSMSYNAYRLQEAEETQKIITPYIGEAMADVKRKESIKAKKELLKKQIKVLEEWEALK